MNIRDEVGDELRDYDQSIDNSPSKPEKEKLTDWKKEPSLEDLKADLESSKSTHDSFIAKLNNWSNLLNVEGSEKPKKREGRSSVQPKLIRKQAEWRYSALSEAFLSSEKLFQIEPVTFEDVDSARKNELVINWQFRTKLNSVKFIDEYVRSGVDEGTTIVRVGWNRETETVKEMVDVYEHEILEDPQEIEIFQQILAIKASNPREYDEEVIDEIREAVNYYEETGEITSARKVKQEEEEVEKILKNHPTVKVCDPKNVIIDPSCEGDLSKAMFVIASIETNMAELKTGSIEYKNLEHIDFNSIDKATETDHETKTPIEFQFKDKARRKLVMWEYWGFYDIEGNGKLEPIVASWIGNTLIRLDRNPFPDQKVPYVLVTYMPKKRELHGEPDAELLGDNQRIVGAVMRGMIDLMGRSANAQRGIAKDLLDPLNRRRYELGQDYEFNPTSNPNLGVIEHKFPELPASAFNMLSLQNQDAESLSGIKSFSGGLSGEAYGDVAAAIKGMLDASTKREMSILRRMAKGIKEIGDKIISMNAAFLSEEETIRITNEEFETVKREDLAGNYDSKVDISTAEMDNARAQELGFMLQTIGNTMDPTIMVMILAEIATLKKMPALAQVLRNWQPQRDPLDDKLKQLQIEEQQLKNEELRSKVNLNNAKAQETGAKANKTTLDAIEQETGTTHARNMENMQAQSQGNQDLEIVKSLLKGRKPEEVPGDIEAGIGYAALSKIKNDPLQ